MIIITVIVIICCYVNSFHGQIKLQYLFYIFVFIFCSADPLSNVSLEFDTMEEAIAYAVKNGKYIRVTMWCTYIYGNNHLIVNEKRRCRDG